MKQQQRSLSLDFFKLFLSFFIVAGHLQPLFAPDALEGWLITNGFARVLVPCFFMINGFFLASKLDDLSAVKKYCIQILKVYAIWSLFYLYFYYDGTGIVTILGRLFFGFYHLWYLPALLSGVIILILVKKVIKKDSHLLIFILIIYLIGNLLSPLRNSGVMAHYFRNGFFMGFPFIAFGYFIKKHKLKDVFESWQIIAIIIISFGILMLESYLYYIEGMKITDMYLSALIISPAAILLCLKHPFTVNRTIVTDYFSELSGAIYYIHLFFVFKMYDYTYNIYGLPWIFLAAVLATIPIIFINRRVRIFL